MECLHGVFADVLPPDVIDGAGKLLGHKDVIDTKDSPGSHAVDTLCLIRPDDYVGDGGSFFENENGICVSGFGLLFANSGCGSSVKIRQLDRRVSVTYENDRTTSFRRQTSDPLTL